MEEAQWGWGKLTPGSSPGEVFTLCHAPVKRLKRQGDDVASALRERSPADTPAGVCGVSHLPHHCGWFKGRLISWFSKILPGEKGSVLPLEYQAEVVAAWHGLWSLPH